MTGSSEDFFDLKITGDTVFFDRHQCRRRGEEFHADYVKSDPFPHLVIDNFLPRDCLKQVVREFPDRGAPRFQDEQSRLKVGYKIEEISSPFITNLLNALNSSQFLEFLEELTGIEGLLPDPHFNGGGLHETASGGHLSIHADFNILPRLKLQRRINLILFLNDDWREDYGGELELWSRDMKECRRSVLPVMGRAVIFNTDKDSFHGHPDPTTSPPDIYRRSIAIYYYTAADAPLEQWRTTDFRRRPNSIDKAPPLSVRLREIVRDFTPPVLHRKFLK